MAQGTPLGFPAHTLPFRCGEVATLSTGSGARYHRRGMGACEGVLRKSRSVHGGSGRFVARGRAADGKKFFSAEGGTWGGWAETLSLQGVQGSAAQRGAAEKSFDGFRQDRVWLRNGWIYVNLRNKTFRADRGGAPAVSWAFLWGGGPGS